MVKFRIYKVPLAQGLPARVGKLKMSGVGEKLDFRSYLFRKLLTFTDRYLPFILNAAPLI